MYFNVKGAHIFETIIIFKSSEYYNLRVMHSGLGRRFRSYKKSHAARFRISSRSIVYRHIGSRVLSLGVYSSPSLTHQSSPFYHDCDDDYRRMPPTHRMVRSQAYDDNNYNNINIINNND